VIGSQHVDGSGTRLGLLSRLAANLLGGHHRNDHLLRHRPAVNELRPTDEMEQVGALGYPELRIVIGRRRDARFAVPGRFIPGQRCADQVTLLGHHGAGWFFQQLALVRFDTSGLREQESVIGGQHDMVAVESVDDKADRCRQIVDRPANRTERFILGLGNSVPEQGGGSLIPDGPLNPGVMHTVATGSAGHLGLYRLETQVTAGNGTLKTSGLGSNSSAKEGVKVGYDYFKAIAGRVSASIKAGDHDYHLQVVELHNTDPNNAMTLASFIALCSAVFGKPLQQQMVVLGSMSLGGNIIPVENLAESLQVAFDAGAKRILLPMASVKDIPTIPGELFAKFQTSFYADPVDAVFKSLGVE